VLKEFKVLKVFKVLREMMEHLLQSLVLSHQKQQVLDLPH